MFKQLVRARRAALPSWRASATATAIAPASSSSAVAARRASGSSSSSSRQPQSPLQSRALSTSKLANKETASSSSSTVKASANPHIPSASASEQLLQVTTLPNGVRVATDGTPGHFVAAGVYVGAGSRFEWEGNSGSSHMIDRLAYKVKLWRLYSTYG